MTLQKIREQLREAFYETSFYPQTNQTYYPARWSYGAGAGDASSARYYDQRLNLAAARVADLHGLGAYDLDDDVTTQREAAVLVLEAIRRHDGDLALREAALETD